MIIPNSNIVFKLFDRYGLSSNEKEELLSIIANIYIHDEFQRRMTSGFAHHGELTLGEHILETTIMSYIIAKKRKKIDLNTAVKIAMFHDLYTCPWQNSPIKDKEFSHYHGFRHPIEGIINASVWFPKEFTNIDEARVIIDGMAHHMFPLPVTRYIEPSDIQKENPIELRNIELLSQITPQTNKLLIETTSRGAIGDFSFAISNTQEGRVIVTADKLASLSDVKPTDINSITALVTGKNKGLIKKRQK